MPRDESTEIVIRGRRMYAQPCEECGGQVFAYRGASRSLRSDATFCTNACRQRAYRRRKKVSQDPQAALDQALSNLDRIMSVTHNCADSSSSTPDSRNA